MVILGFKALIVEFKTLTMVYEIFVLAFKTPLMVYEWIYHIADVCVRARYIFTVCFCAFAAGCRMVRISNISQ